MSHTNEQIEQLASKVHDSWWEEKKKQDFHAPRDCQSENRRSYDRSPQTGKDHFDDAGLDEKTYKWCDKCHPNMYPYEELPEDVKEYDRITVRTVLKAQEELKISQLRLIAEEVLNKIMRIDGDTDHKWRTIILEAMQVYGDKLLENLYKILDVYGELFGQSRKI